MRILVNEEPRDIETATLAGLLDELGYGDARVATAVNGAFVPASRRGSLTLDEGARVEILAPMQGG
ncbi:sulfur carrier protein ThiS [Gluconacetobacter tumulicola]|uniref:Sulfur carrier protein ThiS n=1 Tax=Gluconacetobacter tumulicola TaxID=1017177 RepID=A0A7W4JDL3_9PROT|nr:sulfur carrier protein ThiS [Gluconacetobacter tumulicola]MBB2179223.1 sulfur carrier protein ThiS [Gluconacetobacter tumulicola]